jgi:hypothetical protein
MSNTLAACTSVYLVHVIMSVCRWACIKVCSLFVAIPGADGDQAYVPEHLTPVVEGYIAFS